MTDPLPGQQRFHGVCGMRPPIGGRISGVIVLLTLAVLLAGSLPSGTHPDIRASLPLAVPRTNAMSNSTVVSAPGPTPSWAPVSTSVSPPARDSGAMAYDAKDGYTVLFGGESTNGTRVDLTIVYLHDTWTFKSGEWTQLPVSGPATSVLIAMAFDPIDGYLVAYGGCSGDLSQNTSNA